MITPKQKATDLILTFYNGSILEYSEAVEFAKICIDEQIRAVIDYSYKHQVEVIPNVDFLNEVKSEIEKL